MSSSSTNVSLNVPHSSSDEASERPPASAPPPDPERPVAPLALREAPAPQAPQGALPSSAVLPVPPPLSRAWFLVCSILASIVALFYAVCFLLTADPFVLQQAFGEYAHVYYLCSSAAMALLCVFVGALIWVYRTRKPFTLSVKLALYGLVVSAHISASNLHAVVGYSSQPYVDQAALATRVILQICYYTGSASLILLLLGQLIGNLLDQYQ